MIKKRTYFKKVLLLFSGLLGHVPMYSQYYSSGEDPAFIHWRHIQNKYFDLVFDEKYEAQAQKLATYLDFSSNLVGDTNFRFVRKLPVIIHNHSIISNGSVSWAPRKMEIYTVPPQDMYAQGWLEQLAIHEGRHVAQMYRLNQGLTKVGSYLFGEQAIGPAVGQTHTWFLEGDAVTTETALSEAGRGRLPSFEMGYRALLLDEKRFAFRKAVFGSYNDYVPNHYELGFLLVAYNRARYSPELWNSTLDRIGFRSLFATQPFNRGVKKFTNLNRTQLYGQTMDYYANFWKQQYSSLDFTEVTKLNNLKKKHFTSYISPVVEGNYVYAIKSGIDDLPTIVAIDRKTGIEKIIHRPGTILSERITLRNGILFWDEYKGDIRWPQQSYSEIKALQIKTRQVVTLTRKSRYAAPAISPDGTMIAVTESDVSGNNSLILLDAFSGAELEEIPVPQNAAIQLPAWNERSNRLIMTRVGDDGKNLVEYDLKNHHWKNMTQPGHFNISSPVYQENRIYFNASYSAIDNIFVLDTSKNEIFQLSSVKNGAFSPNFSANSDTIFFSNYTSNGFDLVFQVNDPKNYIPFSKIKKIQDTIIEKIASHESIKFDYSKLPTTNYISKPYSKFSHLINVHSWYPVYRYQNPEGPSRNLWMPGVLIFLQNLQNTLIAEGGAGYAYGKSYSNFKFTYAGLFPVLTTEIFYGDSINFIENKNHVSGNSGLFQISNNIFTPLNFSEGNTIIHFVPGILQRYENRYYQTMEKGVVKQGLSKYALYASFQLFNRYEAKYMSPRWGIDMYFKYQEPVSNKLFAPSQMLLLDVFLPGILKFQSVRLGLQHETHEVKYYFNSSMLSPLRGFEGEPEPGGIKKQTIFSVDYFVPIAYPDMTLLKVLYIKRLKSTLFFDQAFANLYYKGTFMDRKYFSTGVELLSDLHPFFWPFEFSFGARISYLSSDKVTARFLYQMNF